MESYILRDYIFSGTELRPLDDLAINSTNFSDFNSSYFVEEDINKLIVVGNFSGVVASGSIQILVNDDPIVELEVTTGEVLYTCNRSIGELDAMRVQCNNALDIIGGYNLTIRTET